MNIKVKRNEGRNKMKKNRCKWVTKEPVYIKYHDEEWGNFNQFKNDQYLFEMLTLEGAQAGLSWITILKRRENYRKAFAQFDPIKVSEFGHREINTLLQNEGIIRNKRKIESTINNAKAFLQVQSKFGSFHTYLIELFNRKLPIVNNWDSGEEVPAQTGESVMLSKNLRKRGFTFVGPVICYSFMQAVGLVNDHTKDCWLYKGDKG